MLLGFGAIFALRRCPQILPARILLFPGVDVLAFLLIPGTDRVADAGPEPS